PSPPMGQPASAGAEPARTSPTTAPPRTPAPGATDALDPPDRAAPRAAPAGAPPAPVPPAVITRDEAGNATVRAIRLAAPLDLDGRLDEPVYREVAPLDGFIQSLPDEGAPATELTE